MTFRNVTKEMERAGWKLVRVNGSHYQYKHPNFQAVATVVCHGGRDISKGVIDNLKKVTGLSFTR